MGTREWGLVAGLLAGALLPGVGHAQSIAPPKPHGSMDERGVDLATGAFHTATPAISVGAAGAGGLSFQREWDSSVQGWRDTYENGIALDTSVTPNTYTVTILGQSRVFTFNGTAFVEREVQGESLTFSSATNKYTFTGRDGTVGVFDKLLASDQPNKANEGRLATLTSPSGERLTFTYTALSGSGFLAHRLQSVTSNLGYQVKLEYQTSNADQTGLTLTKATAINNAVDYCSPTSNTACSYTQTWPSLTFASPNATTQTVTDALNRTTTYTFTGAAMTAVRRPTSATNTLTVSYNASNEVQTVWDGAQTWTYTFGIDPVSQQRSGSVTDANNVGLGGVTVDLTSGRLVAQTDGLGHTVNIAYNANKQIDTISGPEGNLVRYTYDARGNVTLARNVAKSGSGLADITISAAFPASCTNIITCNQPTSTTDERGFTTDYTYDATHGGVLTVTAPDPDGGGPLVRPQTRYTYALHTAKAKDAGGTLVNQTPSVYRLTEISSCATLSSCANGADETRTVVAYATNNLLPSGITVRDGANTLVATTTPVYDAVGNPFTVDGPLSGTADTVRYRFDAMRQTVGVVGPDPDGAGALKNRATRLTYNLDGQVTTVEQGRVNSQADADWAGFVALDTANSIYDALGRQTRATYVGSGGTQNVTQMSYDVRNRLECVAVRMNPAVFASLPASACTLGTEGANGPDRIVRSVYDNADRVISTRSAVGTALEQTTSAVSYAVPPISNSILPQTLTDANGNVATFEYDGFNRLSKIRFPNTSGGGSSTTDYEQYTYDAASNVTVTRLRDGNTVSASYDNLNRPTQVSSAIAPTVTMAYDSFGRTTSQSASGQTLAMGYDALSRLTAVTGSPLGAVTYQYDIAGRRTRITWPDALYAQYDFNLADEVTAIRENGAASGAGVLATYAYDDLGRRTSITRGNGVTTSYGYDAASRLQTLTQSLGGGGANDITYGFTYNAANQVLARTVTTSATGYAFVPPNLGRSYTPNGLNQYASVNGVAYAHDGRGNLTGDGTKTWSYDGYGRLTSGTGGTLSYDPTGRLYETAGGSTTRFLYDGPAMIGEYNASNALLRRYVPGPGMDETVAWYEGAGTADRRWLIADALGSTVAVTNASGAALQLNAYDEWGAPASSNLGRFQYTGQAWLPELGLYHYKARAYAPAIGRFMQPDPILWDGGMNLYAYVGNDPLNGVDPWGLDRFPTRQSGNTTCTERPTPPTPDFPKGGSQGDCSRGSADLSLSFGWASRGFGQQYEDRGGVSREADTEVDVKCPTGPYVSAQAGVGAALAFGPAPVSMSIQANITGPVTTTHGWFSPVGSQVSITGQFNLMVGGGLFIGAGTQYGLARSTSAARPGTSTATGYHAEVQGGYGATAGVSVDTSVNKNGTPNIRDSALGVGGKTGGGIGVMAGAGLSRSATWASPQFGCKP